jgi:hypothetical protein
VGLAVKYARSAGAATCTVIVNVAPVLPAEFDAVTM